MEKVKADVDVVNVIKPRVELVLTWGSEELIAVMTDVVYRAYAIEDAMRRVKEKPELVTRRITNFLRDGPEVLKNLTSSVDL